jgi:calcium and integrin-binding protein 1
LAREEFSSFISKNKLQFNEMMSIQVNPFNDRIVKVFSSSDTGDMTFEDFLDMMSVFSDGAPKNVKVEYAFRISEINQ